MTTRFRRAIVRRPAPDYQRGISTQEAGAGDPERCAAEHAAYVAALEDAGLAVEVLDPLEHHPDAHFVEDVAVITPEVRVLARPGAAARRGEAEALAPVLERVGALERIREPATLDGGDVLVVGRDCFVGLSSRTDRAGAAQLAALLEPHGYRCRPVEVGRGLHLKSSVTAIGPLGPGGDDALLVTPAFAGHEAFAAWRRIETAPGEEYAANVLRVNDRLLVPRGYPETLCRLQALDLELVPLAMGEARRMDGGLTCLSLRF